MKTMLLLPGLLAAVSLSAAAETVNFDAFSVGNPPAPWKTGQRGKGTAVWKIEADPSAPSKPNVLHQSGSANYGWAVKTDTAIADGAVEVKFKPLAGRRAQAGGVIFRFKSPEQYYVARANANENNVNLYRFDDSGREEVKVVETPVALNQWHTLRAEFQGKHIRVLMDGKVYIDLEDAHISGPGAVGVWTRFDSNTLFDDFTY
jgi:3-keto-disaccharide hydrolase